MFILGMFVGIIATLTMLFVLASFKISKRETWEEE